MLPCNLARSWKVVLLGWRISVSFMLILCFLTPYPSLLHSSTPPLLHSSTPHFLSSPFHCLPLLCPNFTFSSFPRLHPSLPYPLHLSLVPRPLLFFFFLVCIQYDIWKTKSSKASLPLLYWMQTEEQRAGEAWKWGYHPLHSSHIYSFTFNLSTCTVRQWSHSSEHYLESTTRQ